MPKLLGYLGRFRFPRATAREEGASLVEFALSASVLFMMLIGIIEISLALYTYNYVCDAAREATRYAIVRGSDSCLISSSFPDCNLSPSSSGNPLQTYVQNLGYPGLDPARLTATATWLSPSTTTPVTWSACTAAVCNGAGNAVNVVVTYQFPLGIPFIPATTLNMSGTSQMVISE